MKVILKAVGIVSLGAFGMWAYWTGHALYLDWRFLRDARITVEQRKAMNEALVAIAKAQHDAQGK